MTTAAVERVPEIWKRLVMIAGAIAATGTATRADRREASVHVQAVGGVASVGHDAAEATGSGGLGGLAVRASYATKNEFQYDAQLSVLYGRAAFDAGTFRLGGGAPTVAPFVVSGVVARLDAGVTLRLGVRWIPTVRLAAGVQAVRRGSPVVTVGGVEFSGDDTAPAAVSANLIGSATVGLDYRVDRRLIVGAAAGATAAVPGLRDAWREATITIHVARYWYPRW